jgi:hypothetical protein
VRAEVRACKSHCERVDPDPTVVVLPPFSLLCGPVWLGSLHFCLLLFEKLACSYSRWLDLGTRLFVLWFEEEVLLGLY